MWLPHFLHRNRLMRPNACALAEAGRQVTWRELDDRTSSLAQGLLNAGVSAGDRLLILSANRIEVLELYFAIAKVGAIACPVNPTLPLPEVEYIAANVLPVGIFAERMVMDRIGARLNGWTIAIGEDHYAQMACGEGCHLRLPRQTDIAMIFSTSATTGRPKAVMVSHRSIMASYLGMAAESQMSHEDIMLNPCPLFHGSTVIGLALLAAGGQLLIEREFKPQRFLSDVERYRATRAFLVPSMVRFALAAKAFDGTDLSSLREVMYGGAPITQELLQDAVARFGCRFRGVYGITEGGGPIALVASDELPRSVEGRTQWSSPPAGRMMLGAQVVVMDDAHTIVPAGEVGEICMRGDGIMDGYWGNDEASSNATAGGWLHTGDLGYIDTDGFIFLIDRKNDLIIRGGQNVYPAEIERVIGEQLGVEDVAALGAPSLEWGEEPVVFVVPEHGVRLNPIDLFAACNRELASYKRPVAIHLVDEIPRNAAGKILRRVLRERLEPNGRTNAVVDVLAGS